MEVLFTELADLAKQLLGTRYGIGCPYGARLASARPEQLLAPVSERIGRDAEFACYLCERLRAGGTEFYSVALELVVVVLVCSRHGIVQPTGCAIRLHCFGGKHQTVLYKKNEMWGIKDNTGKIIIEPTWRSARLSNTEPLIRFRVDKKWGLASSSGDVILEPSYDGLGDFVHGIAVAEKGDLYGFLDSAGKEIGDFSYEKVDPRPSVYVDESEHLPGLWWVSKGEGWGLLDIRSGKILGGYQWEHANMNYGGHGYKFSESRAWVKRGGKWGVVDQECNLIVQAEWSFAGLNRESNDSALRRLTKKGQVAPDFIGPYSRVKKDGQVGVLSVVTGKLIVPPNWDDCDLGVGNLIFGMSIERWDQYWGESSIESLSAFFVKKGEKWGLVDSDGELIVDPIWNSPGRYISPESFLIKIGELEGVYNVKGEEVCPAIWDEIRGGISWSANDRMGVKKDGKWGLARLDGTVVVEPKWGQRFRPEAEAPELEGLAKLRASLGNDGEKVDGNGKIVNASFEEETKPGRVFARKDVASGNYGYMRKARN